MQVDNTSLKDQEDKIRMYAKLHDIVIDEMFIDKAVSGKSTDRPEYDKMMDYVKENNIEHILVSARGIKRVNTSEFRCDFYDLVDGDEKAAEKFFGEYMLEYSWAEERMALLSKYI